MQRMSAMLWAWLGVSAASLAAALAVVAAEARIESEQLARVREIEVKCASASDAARAVPIVALHGGPVC